MDSNKNKDKNDFITLLQSNAEEEDGKKADKVFKEIVFRLVELWEKNRANAPTWPPGFQHQAAKLLRRFGNRWGFQIYLSECEMYGEQSTGDGFPNFCSMRSRIQLIIDEFVPFSDLVHPDDEDQLEELDEMCLQQANEIPPISPENVPSWVPESHWWWWAPTNHNMSQREIHEKLYDYHPEDWDNE